MVTTKDDVSSANSWYLDTNCSTHMTRHGDGFENLDESVKIKVKFADDNTLNARSW